MKTAVRIFDRFVSQILYLTADKFKPLTDRYARSLKHSNKTNCENIKNGKNTAKRIKNYVSEYSRRGEGRGRGSKQCHGLQML